MAKSPKLLQLGRTKGLGYIYFDTTAKNSYTSLNFVGFAPIIYLLYKLLTLMKTAHHF